MPARGSLNEQETFDGPDLFDGTDLAESDAFLSHLEDGQPDEAFLTSWPGIDAALDVFPERLVGALDRASRTRGAPTVLNPSALARAAFTADGQSLHVDSQFHDWLDLPCLPDHVLQEDQSAGWPRTFLAPERAGPFAPVILIRAREAPGWLRLDDLYPYEIRDRAAYFCIAFRPSQSSNLSELARDAFGLTGLEARVTDALVHARKLPEAALQAGVSYDTAREAIAAARAKAGAKSQSDLIARVVALGAGTYGRPVDAVSFLVDCYGLTVRQARLAMRIAEGVSRAEAAKACGVSEHVTKAELKRVYEVLDVASATDLALVVAETSALARIAAATDVELQAVGEESHPLRFVRRPSGQGQIALSDYGPVSGTPVLVTHSETNGRRIARHLLHALRAQGFRPISIDRPGYGLTDPVGGDPFYAAADDMALVLDTLKIDAACIVTRSGDSAALAFAHKYPDRFINGVLINPRNPNIDSVAPDNMINMTIRLFQAHPERIAGFTRMLVNQLSPGFMERCMREALKSSPPDIAVADDPELLQEFIGSARLAIAGHTSGFVNEMLALSQGWSPPPVPDGSMWTALVGVYDPLSDYDADADKWHQILPGHRLVKLEDGGRFLHLTHAPLVAQLLSEGHINA